MSEDPTASRRYRLSSLTDKGALARLAAICAIAIGVVACFAYVAGWLTPGRLTQARLIDRFEEVSGGVHSGFRRNHAKGVCVTGSFESNGQGVRLSKAIVFRPGSVPVVGRFSLAGGHPHMADGPTDVRAMGLSLRPLDGGEWRMAMIDLPVFVVKHVEDLYEQLRASQPDPATGKPDPAKMAAFAAAHPEFVRAVEVIKSQSIPVRLRQRRLQRPSCIPVRQCGRCRDARAMVDDGDRAVRTANTRARQEPGQELPV